MNEEVLFPWGCTGHSFPKGTIEQRGKHTRTSVQTSGRAKNLGRFWLAYTELQGDIYMLQLMTDDSGHVTRPELSL